MRRAALVLLSSLALAGCDQLFPELTGAMADLAALDGGTDINTGVLAGRVCRLADVRSPQSCKEALPTRHVTIEETRAGVSVNADGTFALSLEGVRDQATIAVADDPGVLNASAPTISHLSGGILSLARVNGVALPSLPAETLTSLQLQLGVAPNAAHGVILAWIVSDAGVPLASAAVARIVGATGPFYDVGGSIADGDHTGAYGVVALFDLAPGDATLVVSTSPQAAFAGDTFKLPVRAGAVTTAALALPKR